MRNCLILGAGRSGTSLLAGMLADSGYNLGENLYGPTISNPTGYYESAQVNELNEQLLAQVVRARPKLRIRGGHDLLAGRAARRVPVLNRMPGHGQRWLAKVPLDSPAPVPTPEQIEVMSALFDVNGWCYKDPRFSFTLPAWRPFVGPDVLFICVFRDPGSVVSSVLTDARAVEYLRNLKVTSGWALGNWIDVYTHILRRHAADGDWMFLLYDDILSGDAAARLGDRLGVSVSTQRADPALRRSEERRIKSAVALSLFEELRQRAAA